MFDARGYGEVATPALEYEEVLTRGDPAAADPAYRLFDEHGNVLVLRSDMTIPIARVVATRYPTAPTPLRFYYLQHAYRAVRQHRGQPREILQAGIELVGAPGPEGTAEAVSVLCAALDAAGLGSYKVGLGDASLFGRALERAGRAGGRAPLILQRAGHARPGRARARADAAPAPAELLDVARTPRRDRGARRRARRPSRCRRSTPGWPTTSSERVIFDLGLVRTLGYYTGAVFEVYDAAFGSPLGGGGRYDDLLGRFGRELPACGWALDVERVHAARLEEGDGMRIAVPRGAMFKETLDAARHARDRHAPRSAPTTASCSSRTPGSSRCGRPTSRPTSRRAPPTSASRARTCWPSRASAASTSCSTSASGRARWSSRPSRARTPPPRRCGGSGMMRIATKYSRIAARYFERTGRQVEIVEVKGSVELAPLTGMVARRSSTSPRPGTTLRENGLVVREEIMRSTARLIANPVSYRVKAAEIDAVRGAACVRAEDAARRRRGDPRRGAAGRVGGRRTSRRSSPTCARGGDDGAATSTRRASPAARRTATRSARR